MHRKHTDTHRHTQTHTHTRARAHTHTHKPHTIIRKDHNVLGKRKNKRASKYGCEGSGNGASRDEEEPDGMGRGSVSRVLKTSLAHKTIQPISTSEKVTRVHKHMYSTFGHGLNLGWENFSLV